MKDGENRGMYISGSKTNVQTAMELVVGIQRSPLGQERSKGGKEKEMIIGARIGSDGSISFPMFDAQKKSAGGDVKLSLSEKGGGGNVSKKDKQNNPDTPSFDGFKTSLLQPPQVVPLDNSSLGAYASALLNPNAALSRSNPVSPRLDAVKQKQSSVDSSNFPSLSGKGDGVDGGSQGRGDVGSSNNGSSNAAGAGAGASNFSGRGGADSGAGSRNFSGVGPIDGDEEECNWSDIDIDVVGRDKEMVGGKKKTKKGGSGINEIGGIGVGMARKKLDERMFSCGEPGCEYFS